MGDLVEMNGTAVKRLLGGADWQPIARYDKEKRPVVLLRGAGANQWTLAYWGVLDAPWLYDERLPAYLVPEPKPFWRKAIEWDKGLPVGFDPISFAMVDEGTIDRLSGD